MKKKVRCPVCRCLCEIKRLGIWLCYIPVKHKIAKKPEDGCIICGAEKRRGK